MKEGRTFHSGGTVAALVSVLALAFPAAAAAAWSAVGSALNFDQNNDASHVSAAAIAGDPYATWDEVDVNGNNQVRVARLSGSTWTAVGGSLNVDPTKAAGIPSIADFGGVPYVAWDEADHTVNSSAVFEIRVARFVAGAWHAVGGSPNLNVTTGNARDPHLADVGGVPYVVFSEDDGSGPQIHVARFTGSAWTPVGTALGGGQLPGLADVAGVPYVVWQDLSGGEQIRVARFTSGAWHTVGGSLNFDTSKQAATPSIADVGGVPYVAWHESNGSAEEIRVARLAGSTWSRVGESLNFDQTENAVHASIADIGGAPCVAWEESTGTVGVHPDQIRVARFVGGGWTFVGSSLNFDPTKTGADPSLMSVAGVPHVAWHEATPNVLTGSKIRVARLQPDFLQSIAVSTDTMALLLTKVRDYGVPLPIGFRHGPGSSLGTSTPLQRTTGDGYDAVFTELAGLKPNTTYSWQPFSSDTFRQLDTGPVGRFTTKPAPSPAKLIVIAFRASTTRGHVAVHYALTAAAKLTLAVKPPHGAAVAVASASRRAGVGKLTWNRKLHGKRAKPGTYRLTVTAASGGKTTSSTLPVKLR